MATTVAYWLAVVAFAVGVGVVLAIRRSIGNSAERRAVTYMLVIPVGAGLSYVAMALGIGTISVNGLSLNLPRYIDWFVTTPFLIGFVGYAADAPRSRIAGSMIADALMIVTGMVAVVTQGPVRWAFFGASSLFYLGLLWYLYYGFSEYLGNDPVQIGLYTLLKNHIALLWLAYPLVWFAGPNGVGFATTAGVALTFAFLDVLAKLPFVYFFYMYRGLFADDQSEDGATGASPVADSTPADAD